MHSHADVNTGEKFQIVQRLIEFFLMFFSKKNISILETYFRNNFYFSLKVQ